MNMQRNGRQQLLFIHGGTTWATREDYKAYLHSYPLERIVEKMIGEKRTWSRGLGDALGDDWEVLAPSMPCAQFARYDEWALWLEKIAPLLRDGVVLVGHSLGGVFLAKYLSENNFPVRIAQLHLVAAPMEDTPDEPLCDFNFDDVEKLRTLEEKAGEIIIYHSEDDPVVPFKDAMAYAHYLASAEFVRFTDRGHFLQEDFPELIVRIRAAEEGLADVRM